MIQDIAGLGVALVGIYALLGLVFALAFALRGAGRLDPAARAGTWGFRLLVIPGAAAFWPLLALRWVRGLEEPPGERNAHRDAASPGMGGRS